MPCSWMVLMELPVGGSVGAVPVFVLLRIRKTSPMRRVVLGVELLMELLVLQMIVKVIKDALIIVSIMGKGRRGGHPQDQCRCNDQRSSHGRFPGRAAFGAQRRFHDTFLRHPARAAVSWTPKMRQLAKV